MHTFTTNRFLIEPYGQVAIVVYIGAYTGLSITPTILSGVIPIPCSRSPGVLECITVVNQQEARIYQGTHTYLLSPKGNFIYAALWEETEEPGENACWLRKDVLILVLNS